MMKRLASLVRDLAAWWDRFWFTPADPTNVAVMRIGVGLVLLYTHLASTPELLDQIGPSGWIDAEAIAELREMGADAPAGVSHVADRWWGQSVWFYVQNPAAIYLLHGLFLTAIVCFTLGQWSRVMTIVVWLFHLSYIHRSFLAWYGLDSVIVAILFYLMMAPTGATLSLDQLWRQRRTGHRAGRTGTAGDPTCLPSWSANVALRMIQIHMCIVYLCAGLAKIRGARWWDGTAVWITMNLEEFAPFDISWLARFGDGPCLVISTAGVALTLFVEISFAFLIWNRHWRPVLLSLAVMMHVAIGAFMGMGCFQLVMLIGDLSFVAPEPLRSLLQWQWGRLSAGEETASSAISESIGGDKRERVKRAA